jgi:hypothetical protein
MIDRKRELFLSERVGSDVGEYRDLNTGLHPLVR